MTDTLLRSLRENMLDESESLAGLLRKCLLLGAETGSDSLRQWARSALYGYNEDASVPSYRTLSNIPIVVDSISGNHVSRGQIISRVNLPRESWEYVPEDINFRQPVEELQQAAGMSSFAFSSPALTYAQMLGNEQLGDFQSIVGLHYTLTGSTISGMLGQIRTRLVDIVAELTATTPLTELPRKERVDSAMNLRLGDVYATTVSHADGPIAIGAGATARTEGLGVKDVLQLLEVVRASMPTTGGEDVAEVVSALKDLNEALAKDVPDTGDVVRKSGHLRSTTDKLGLTALTAAVTTATTAITKMAMNGAFS